MSEREFVDERRKRIIEVEERRRGVGQRREEKKTRDEAAGGIYRAWGSKRGSACRRLGAPHQQPALAFRSDWRVSAVNTDTSQRGGVISRSPAILRTESSADIFGRKSSNLVLDGPPFAICSAVFSIPGRWVRRGLPLAG